MTDYEVPMLAGADWLRDQDKDEHGHWSPPVTPFCRYCHRYVPDGTSVAVAGDQPVCAECEGERFTPD